MQATTSHGMQHPQPARGPTWDPIKQETILHIQKTCNITAHNSQAMNYTAITPGVNTCRNLLHFRKNIITHDIHTWTLQYDVHEVLSQTGQHNPHIQNFGKVSAEKKNSTAHMELHCYVTGQDKWIGLQKFAINSRASVSQNAQTTTCSIYQLFAKCITQLRTIDRFTKLKCNVHRTPKGPLATGITVHKIDAQCHRQTWNTYKQ